MKRLSVCSILAALFGIAAIIGLIVTLRMVSGDDNLTDRQNTLNALVDANQNLAANNAATLTASAPTNTPTATPQAAQTLSSSAGQRVVYLVAPQGTTSTSPLGPFGCGDYLVPVARGDLLPTTTDKQIAYALIELFSIKDHYYGPSELYNALYQSNLTVQSVTVDASGQATVKLSGDYLLAGVCSDVMFREQIEQTALQFSISGVSVFINDKPLADIVSGQG